MPVSYERQRQVLDFLAANPLGVISTVSQDGKPWGAAVYYMADASFNISFITRTTTAKSLNLSVNPKAAFTVASLRDQATVQAYGEVSQVNSTEEFGQILDFITKVGPSTPPILKLSGGHLIGYRLRPTYMQHSDFTIEGVEESATYVKQIIPG